MADDNFYRAFEDIHRGSRELIKSRLSVYLPFILPLQQFFKPCQGMDLGCGRGEWLELMLENAIDVHGVDLDEGMLEASRTRGLKVSHGDAIQSLKSLASESQMLISGFHLAEHLPFDVIQTLIQESLRVLKPGGLFIIETPNPENIVVGTANFYVDPTHQRPIPSQLLSFMVEYSGFEKVKTLKLHEPSGLINNNSLSLLSVLNGVSPDYGVVAQKGGDLEALAATACAFDLNYGLTLENLASSYDQQIKSISHNAEARAQHAETVAQHAAEQVNSILNSTSWKITTPLRIISKIAKKLVITIKVAKSKTKEKSKLFLAHTKLYINQRSRLNRFVLVVLAAFPAVKRQLKQATTPRSLSNTKPLSVVSDESRSALQKSLISAAARWPVGKRTNAPK